jgi:hypothetical protein
MTYCPQGNMEWVSIEFYDKCKVALEKINMEEIDLKRESQDFMVDIFTFKK